MSLPDRVARVITTRSKTVLLVCLLATALVGAGAPLVDDDSSLEQFETDSPEAQAATDIDDRFGIGDEQTTSVQLIHRGNPGENVLEREALLSSLELQAELRADPAINATLTDDDPITGVETLVATNAYVDEAIEDIDERAAALEEREAALEERAAMLEEGIDEARAIERERLALEETYMPGSPAYADAEDELEAAFDQEISERAQQARFGEDRTAEYEQLATEARAIEADLVAIEEEVANPEADPTYQSLQEDLAEVYEGASAGLLADEFESLADAGEDLEDEQADLADADPSLDEQIDVLETIDDETFEDALADTLDEDDGAGLGFMPTDYEPGTAEGDARMTAVSQDVGDGDLEMGAVDDEILESQLEIRDLATSHEHDHVVFGLGILTDEIDRSMGDSLGMVAPLALAFVVLALVIAYRDPLDIALGVAGIGAVLAWTFGFMGWTGIAFNQMMIAVPVLLIGLSIDYAIHVFMRHREHRAWLRGERDRERPHDASEDSVPRAMAIALAGVGVALVWVTATTAIGFLANLVSPIAPIREFAVVSAVGIAAALLVFGALIPAAKVELDALFERLGLDRHKRAFGTSGGPLSRVLSVGATAARRAPLVVLVAVLLLTAGGVYGASQVDTSFDEEDFLAEEPPAWTDRLPAAIQPGEYQAAADLEYVNENFQREDLDAELLVEGSVDTATALERLDWAADAAEESDVTYIQADGEPDIDDPLTLMTETAERDDDFADSFEAADTTGDGVPDQNVTALYDELFEIDEDEASQVIAPPTDGEYDAVRMTVATQGDTDFGDTTDELRAVAAGLDDEGVGDERGDPTVGDDTGGPGAVTEYGGPADDDEVALTAIATGDPIVNYLVEQDLFETVIQSLLVTLVAVVTFLTAAYWLTGNGAILGTVTLLPVAFAVAWIVGTMYLIGLPFNVLTGMITSLTIGLGVAYCIHVSARYTLELERQGNVWTALETTVTGTGGALLGSAATTVGGFGTLIVAILPVLRQFGLITALTITYAFLASVVVLPSLLVIWTRWFGPDVSFDRSQVQTPAATASDGGQTAATDDGRTDAADGRQTTASSDDGQRATATDDRQTAAADDGRTDAADGRQTTPSSDTTRESAGDAEQSADE